MQTKRLPWSPCCIGVAPLWVGSGKNSVRRSPSTSLTRGRLQTFTPPLSALPRSSNRKQRGCLTLAKWETVSGQFGGYLNDCPVVAADLDAKSGGWGPQASLLAYYNFEDLKLFELLIL